MLTIEVQNGLKVERYTFYNTYKSQCSVKKRLLKRFRSDKVVTIIGEGFEPESLLIKDIFTTTPENLNDSGLLLPGKKI